MKMSQLIGRQIRESPRDAEWQRYRTEALARARKIGLKIDIPLKRPMGRCMPRVEPTVAPDGRTDISTIDLIRKGREY